MHARRQVGGERLSWSPRITANGGNCRLCPTETGSPTWAYSTLLLAWSGTTKTAIPHLLTSMLVVKEAGTSSGCIQLKVELETSRWCAHMGVGVVLTVASSLNFASPACGSSQGFFLKITREYFLAIGVLGLLLKGVSATIFCRACFEELFVECTVIHFDLIEKYISLVLSECYGGQSPVWQPNLHQEYES